MTISNAAFFAPDDPQIQNPDWELLYVNVVHNLPLLYFLIFDLYRVFSFFFIIVFIIAISIDIVIDIDIVFAIVIDIEIAIDIDTVIAIDIDIVFAIVIVNFLRQR